jgi:hypothetical protein
MKASKILAGLSLGVFLLAGSVMAADAITSGPQVDKKVPGAFHPLNVTGDKAGEKNCLFCQNGEHPVAMIFAREATPEVTKLIKKIDEATAKNAKAEMGSFVVFLHDEDKDFVSKLKDVAKKEKISTCVLSILDDNAGPQGYHINKDAEVTVVLYTDRTVKANYAFKKGEMKDADIEKIVGDVSKIVPGK